MSLVLPDCCNHLRSESASPIFCASIFPLPPPSLVLFPFHIIVIFYPIFTETLLSVPLVIFPFPFPRHILTSFISPPWNPFHYSHPYVHSHPPPNHFYTVDAISLLSSLNEVLLCFSLNPISLPISNAFPPCSSITKSTSTSISNHLLFYPFIHMNPRTLTAHWSTFRKLSYTYILGHWG